MFLHQQSCLDVVNQLLRRCGPILCMTRLSPSSIIKVVLGTPYAYSCTCHVGGMIFDQIKQVSVL